MKMHLPREAFDPAAAELNAVEEILENAAVASPAAAVGYVAGAARSILMTGGKRLRPLLTLLAARACGCDREAPLQTATALAAAVEMLHTASLLHDDVIDDAVTRRGAPAAHVAAGTKAAILAGDLLFARALSLLAKSGGDAAVAAAAQAITEMVEGEAAERASRRDFAQPEERVLAVAQAKTGALFVLALRLGARAGGASAAIEERLGSFGARLGLAFQLADDVLDIRATAEQLGKQPGTDLSEGTVTLPILYAYTATDADHRAQIARASEPPRAGSNGRAGREELSALLGWLAASSAVGRVVERARAEARAAVELLGDLPACPAKDALALCARAAVERDA